MEAAKVEAVKVMAVEEHAGAGAEVEGEGVERAGGRGKKAGA